MIYARGTIYRVYEETSGGVLAEALSGSWTNGSSLLIEAATDFSPDGGEGVFEPSTAREEAFSYSGVIINASDAIGTKDALTGVIRSAPQSHAKGTEIWDGTASNPTVEKLCDVEVDGELLTGIPIDPSVSTLHKRKAYAPDERYVVPMVFDDDGLARVIDGAVGTRPLVGNDIETLPGIDGEPEPGEINPPPGQGWEDGEPPSTAPTITAVGAIGAIHVRIISIDNSSPVTYKVHCHTTSGFTPADNTLVATTAKYAGLPDFMPLVVVKDFPSGHVLDGGANDPVKAGTTYYFKVIPADGSGDGPTSTQVSTTPVLVQTVDANPGFVTAALIANGAVETAKIALDAITAPLIAANAVTTTEIADNSISTPKLIANSVTAAKIAAGTITATEIATDAITAVKILAGSITTAKIATGAITSNEIAANTITAADIAAGTITSNEIAANTIVAGDIASGTITATQIAASTITADKLSVSTLSAITANLGTVTAGSISGVTITGGTVQTASSGGRIVISSSHADTARFYSSGGSIIGTLVAATDFQLIGSTSAAKIVLGGSTVDVTGDLTLNSSDMLTASTVTVTDVLNVSSGGHIRIGNDANSSGNYLQLRSTGATDPSGNTSYFTIWYDGTNLRGRKGTGAAANIA